jgi:hypothetical protein
VSVSIAFAGSRRWRPPRLELRFDVALDGRGEWAVLPDRLPSRVGSGDVYGVDAYDLDGVAALHGIGPGGFFAFWLETTVELRGVPVAMWNEPPPSVALDVRWAAELQLDGVAAAERLGIDRSDAAGRVVDAAALGDQEAVVKSFARGDRAALAIEWKDSKSERVEVSLLS